MTRALLISPASVAAARRALQVAREHPIPWEMAKHIGVPATHIIKLDEVKKRPDDMPKPVMVLIPIGYRVNVAFEEQPAGIFKHLSIGVDTPGKLPSQEAAEMLLKVFEVGRDVCAAWVEEWAPGEYALNFLQLVAPKEEGHA